MASALFTPLHIPGFIRKGAAAQLVSKIKVTHPDSTCGPWSLEHQNTAAEAARPSRASWPDVKVVLNLSRTQERQVCLDWSL